MTEIVAGSLLRMPVQYPVPRGFDSAMVWCCSFVWCSLIPSIGEPSLSFGEIGFAKDGAGASADRSLDLRVLGGRRSIDRRCAPILLEAWRSSASYHASLLVHTPDYYEGKS